MTALVHHGIQFVQVDKIDCELRIVGSDDADTLLAATDRDSSIGLRGAGMARRRGGLRRLAEGPLASRRPS